MASDNENTNFAKAEIEQNSEDVKCRGKMRVDIMNILKEVSKSVGFIKGRNGNNGTCWRAGKDKIITAAHVVNKICISNGKLDYNELIHIYIDFNYVEHTEKAREGAVIFKVEPKIFFKDESLDIAVLQLKEDGKEFPKALQILHTLDRQTEELDHKIVLISHNKGEPKEINWEISIWRPTKERMEDLKNFSKQYGYDNGYVDLDKSDRLVIQCDFEHGASGSPGITLFNDIPHVVFIYRRGFPDFYYEDNFPVEEKMKFPQDKLFQQGTCIGSFYDGLDSNLTLRDEIFPPSAKDPPSVQIEKLSYTVTTGRYVTLRCTVTSILPIKDVYWQKNVGGTIMKISSTTNNEKYIFSTSVPSLTILCVDQNDEGEYTCFASNNAGTEQSSPTTLSAKIKDKEFNGKCHDCDMGSSEYWCHMCQKFMCAKCNGNHLLDTLYHIVQHKYDMYFVHLFFKVSERNISDLKVLDDGLLVIADRECKQLVTYDISGEQQQSIPLPDVPNSTATIPLRREPNRTATIPLPDEPKSIAVVDNNTVAVTVCKAVKIVDVRLGQVKNHIDLHGSECWGIMCRDNHLFVGCDDGTIRVMNMSGEVTCEVKVDVEIPKYICGEAEHIFYSDGIKMYYFDTEQNIHTKCNKAVESTLVSFPDFRREPLGISTDHEGQVLVISYNSYDVLEISPDGKVPQVIIKQTPLHDSRPRICYHLSSESIVIGHWGYVYVYKKD